MKIRVIKKDQQTESNWSGGKTRQLAIFPEDSAYLDRDFIWRLSTAESDREESSFSRLEGFDRILMVLKGDVVLAHGQERSVHLGEMEQDSFDGGIKTKCFGRLEEDYNLIMAKGCRGSLRAVQLSDGGEDIRKAGICQDSASSEYRSYGVFCIEGYAVVSCDEKSEMIRPGTQLVIDLDPSDSVIPKIMGEGRCILAEVAFEAGEELKEMNSKEEKDPGFAASYGTCMKLFLRNNKWSKMMRREGSDRVYYDKPMSKALRKLERRYTTTVVWAIVCLLCFLPALLSEKVVLSIALAAAYTILHMIFVAPYIYYKSLPKPIASHMKSVDELNAFERVHHAEEIADDPHLQRVMRKYAKDDENYFADEKSVLYKLVKKK